MPLPISGHHRRRQNRKAADPRQNINTGGLRLGIEFVDAEDKIRPIGKIEIIRPRRNRRPDNGVRVCAIGLKRTGRIDHQIGRLARQRPGHIEAVQRQRPQTRPAPPLCAKAPRLRPVASGDKNFEARHINQQVNQTPAKDAVAAQKQHPHPRLIRNIVHSRSLWPRKTVSMWHLVLLFPERRLPEPATCDARNRSRPARAPRPRAPA